MNTSSNNQRSQQPPIIGISGTFASGKDTLSKFLSEHYGYFVESSGDLVRRLSMARHGSIERPDLRETAEYYRKTFGPRFLIDTQIKHYNEQKQNFSGLIIHGLRALGEAKAVKEAGGVLIFVDAPIEERYQRMLSRKRDQEVKLSLEEFKRAEALEWHGGDTDSDFNLAGIKQAADIVLENNGSLESFLSEAVNRLKLPPAGQNA
ncbi:MAG: hypothetical protein EOT04_02460 [Candidatus Chaera renei]|uniref:Dephospho-CoA kinase n=1 Tax=Candidatus Chaera renei TaxID=2506947 RepID=A0A4Q0AIL7_9BACT|nr:MAG: hypothetical protein EOT04_02460 [Candidatus Chaera renei]